MKQLLLLVFIGLLTTNVNAQTESIDIKKFKEDATYREALINRLQTTLPKNDEVGNFSYTLLPQPNLKPGIHFLPLDGMPCLVPDTKDIAVIPNVWKGKVGVPFIGNSPQIPNPFLIQSFRYTPKSRTSDSK